MSAINLTLDQLKSISTEIQGYDNALLSNYLPDVASELQAISSNVQGEELHSIVNTITTHFDSVKQVISQALPKLEEFIDTQMKTYEQTEEQLAEALQTVINKMSVISGQVMIGEGIGNAGKNILEGAEKALDSLFGNNDKAQPEMFDKVTSALNEVANKTVDTMKDIGKDVVNTVTNVAPKTTNKVVETTSNAVNNLADVTNDAINSGLQAISNAAPKKTDHSKYDGWFATELMNAAWF